VNRKSEKFTWVGGIVVLGVEETEGKTSKCGCAADGGAAVMKMVWLCGGCGEEEDGA
jgi:hypothetical protein